jgi:glycine betaine/proline transport system substrate-binding protein
MTTLFKQRPPRFLVFLTLIVSLLGTTFIQAQEEEESQKEVVLTYVDWASEVASSHVVQVVLEEMGYQVDLMTVTAIWMWQAVANGDADAHVAAWLPTTHELYWEAMKDKVENLGPNLEGAQIGLVVPSYVTINGIDELNANADQFNGKIIGIDPASGLMNKTKQVMNKYQLDKLTLVEGSGAFMTEELASAYQNREWIVVTGWTPHWKFSRWDLKYLNDPKGIYKPKGNQAEYIATIVRKGLKKDMPDVYCVLDKFHWEPADMEQLMVWNSEEGADPYQNAKRWVNDNRDKVEHWLCP